MLAYVFWHVPAAAAAAAGYEAHLAAFHARLREAAPPPAGPTATVALDAVPWLGGAAGYEDWYVVADFAALGQLNEVAVSGARKPPHDAAAAASHHGVAGIMGHVAGPLLPAAPAWAAWLQKPAGLAYEAFHAALAEAVGDAASAWQRKMTLGPATEYCVLAGAPLALPWPAAHRWPVRAVIAPGPP